MIMLAASTGYYVGFGVEAALILVGIIVLVTVLKGRKAKKVQTNVTVSFEVNGGTAIGSLSGEPGDSLSPENPVREGYQFCGWFTDTSLTIKADTLLFPEENATYYAAWKQVIRKESAEAAAELAATTPQPPQRDNAATEATAAQNVLLDENAVIISAGKAETIQEAYASLSREQKSFYDELKKYAMGKAGTELSTTKNYESVKIGKRSILKLRVKRKITTAEFLLENDLVKKYRKEGNSEASIKIKPTEVPVYDLNALQTAKDMVDVSLEQFAKEKAEKEEAQKAKRRKA